MLAGIFIHLPHVGAEQPGHFSDERTTKLYDRRQDEIPLDGVERIAI